MAAELDVSALTHYQIYLAMTSVIETKNGSVDVDQIYEQVALTDPTIQKVHVKEVKRQIFQVTVA